MHRAQFNLIAFLLCFCASALAEPSLKRIDIKMSATPALERLVVTTRLHLNASSAGTYSGVFTKPRRIKRFIDEKTRKPIPYKISTLAGVPESLGYGTLEFTLKSPTKTLLLEYEYDRATLAGYAPNPATGDNLHMGQLTKGSIYSSHLYYYPEVFDGAKSAKIEIEVPAGWKAISSGALKSTVAKAKANRSVFTYEANFPSGRLPYSLAIYPYEEIRWKYRNRLPVSIFHAKADAAFAKQKVKVISERVLPFLEKLMGPFPFESLKVVEVFPHEGNTGLAAKGIVMLSQKLWFAGNIDAKLSSEPASVLVDEIAHQWNYYKLQLPNYLAEGVSQYTDALFVEHIQGKAAFAKELSNYREGYKALAAKHGEKPISDPDVYPPLYFLRGALALQVLREKLGDEAFFKATRSLFQSKASKSELTLNDFQKSFETSTSKDLSSFFKCWYLTTDSCPP